LGQKTRPRMGAARKQQAAQINDTCKQRRHRRRHPRNGTEHPGNLADTAYVATAWTGSASSARLRETRERERDGVLERRVGVLERLRPRDVDRDGEALARRILSGNTTTRISADGIQNSQKCPTKRFVFTWAVIPRFLPFSHDNAILYSCLSILCMCFKTLPFKAKHTTS
jgi:hypothetical protein